MKRDAFLEEITEDSGLDLKWRLAGKSINRGWFVQNSSRIHRLLFQ
jgi:hypothetical protein